MCSNLLEINNAHALTTWCVNSISDEVYSPVKFSRNEPWILPSTELTMRCYLHQLNYDNDYIEWKNYTLNYKIYLKCLLLMLVLLSTFIWTAVELLIQIGIFWGVPLMQHYIYKLYEYIFRKTCVHKTKITIILK